MVAQTEFGLGKRVMARRRERGMSRITFANRIGVPVATLRDYECGTEHIGVSVLSEISHALQIPPLALFSADGGSRGADSLVDDEVRDAEADRARLLRAFSGIGDREARLDVIAIVERACRCGGLVDERLESVTDPG